MPEPSLPDMPGSQGGSQGESGEGPEGGGAGEMPGPQGPQGQDPQGQGPDAGSPGSRAGARTPEERQKELDKKLEDSLSEFDGAVLKEKQELASKRASNTSGVAGGTTGGTMSGGKSGGMSGGMSDASGGDTSGRQGSDAGGEETSGGSAGATGGVEAELQGERPEGDERVPSDIPSGRGDDIVARQLREAATNEDDPDLREKLWDEYRRYKGIGGGRKTTRETSATKESVPVQDVPEEGETKEKKEGGGEN